MIICIHDLNTAEVFVPKLVYVQYQGRGVYAPGGELYIGHMRHSLDV